MCEVYYLVKVDVGDGLFKTTYEDVPSKTDKLLSSDEGVYRVVGRAFSLSSLVSLSTRGTVGSLSQVS